MSIESWGLLSKSQDDSEKIEEAIDRIVSAHNDDPDAHLGAGRSVEVHKTNEVLDHPHDSVVPDKISSNFFGYQNFFNVPTVYENMGVNYQDGDGRIGVTLISTGTVSNIVVPIGWLEDRQYPSEGYLCDMIFSYTKTGTPNVFGLLSLGDDYTGFGIAINNTGFRFFSAVAESITYSDYISISSNVMHKLRIIVDPVSLLYSAYLDGELVASFSITLTSDAITYYSQLFLSKVSMSAGQFFGLWLYSLSLKIG